MANVLPQLGLTAQNMEDVIRAVEEDRVYLGEIISDIIEGQRYRDNIMRGFYQRYVGDPADQFDYTDPRLANGVPIYARAKMSDNINHKLHFPFDRMISINKASYAASNIATTFDDEIIGPAAEQVQEEYRQIEDMNAMDALLNECMVSCADRGTSYLVLFSQDRDVHITKDNEWEAVVIYNSSTGIPEYALRYQLYRTTQFLAGYRFEDRPQTTEWMCEWYDGVNVSYWAGQLGAIHPTERDGVHIKPHMFGTEDRPGIPVIELPNNADRVGDVEQTVSLQDAYDIAISDLSSEITQMRLAYLVMRLLGQTIDADFKKKIQDTGIIPIDSETGGAEFLQKNLDTAAVVALRDTLKEGILKFSFSYDPDDLASGSPTAFQIRQKLAGLEQSSSQTLNMWDHQLDYLDRLLMTYFMTFRNMPEYDLTGINRTYTRNIPRDQNAELAEVKNAGGTLSNDYVIRLSSISNQVDLEQNVEELATQEEALFEATGFEDVPVPPEDDTDIQGGDDAEEEERQEETQAPEGVAVSATAGQVGESTNVVQLNGSQVASATAIVTSVGKGELTREAAVNLLHVMFNLEMAQAESLVIGMEEINDNKPQPPVMAPPVMAPAETEEDEEE